MMFDERMQSFEMMMSSASGAVAVVIAVTLLAILVGLFFILVMQFKMASHSKPLMRDIHAILSVTDRRIANLEQHAKDAAAKDGETKETEQTKDAAAGAADDT